MYARISGLYQTISYGQHKLTFREATDNGRFFISKHPSYYYRENYDPQKHVRGFGMFNEEILQQVRAKYGDEFFTGVDMIMIAGTDAGPGWYTPRANATGYGMLGVDFQAAGRRFGRGQGQGGITFEIGSDVGTRDPGDDLLLPLEMVHWTVAHEYGHWLGLGHRRPAWGIYSLMSDKLYTTEYMPEFGPAPLDLFQIMQLGWLQESDTTRVHTLKADSMSAEITLADIRSPGRTVVCKIDMGEMQSTIYICYHRRDNAYDGVYRGEGLLLWRRVGRSISPMPATSDAASTSSPQNGGAETDFVTAPQEFKIRALPGRRHQRRSPVEHARRLQILDVRQRDDRIVFRIRMN